MFAAASGNSTLGIPQSVGKEFSQADLGGKLPARKKKSSVKMTKALADGRISARVMAKRGYTTE